MFPIIWWLFRGAYHVRLAFGVHPMDGVDGQEAAVLLRGDWKPCEAQRPWCASQPCLESQPEDMLVSKWVCLKMGYTPNEIAIYSHLIGIIIISQTIGCRGLAYFQTNPNDNDIVLHNWWSWLFWERHIYWIGRLEIRMCSSAVPVIIPGGGIYGSGSQLVMIRISPAHPKTKIGFQWMACQGLTSYQTKKFLDPNVVSPIDPAPFTHFYHLRSMEKNMPKKRPASSAFFSRM